MLMIEHPSMTVEQASTKTQFGDSGIARQLEQVARIIPVTRSLGTERAAFYVQQAREGLT